MNISALVSDFKKADKAAASAFALMANAASLAAEDFDATKGEKEEYPRISKLVRDALKAEKVALKHERTLFEYFNANLLVAMVPGQLITEKTTKGEIIMRADELKPTVRNIKAAAKQIREAVGLSDKRKSNGAPRTKKAPSTVANISESIRNLAKTDIQALRDILKPLNIRLVVSKS